jgi:hypothetical protein
MNTKNTLYKTDFYLSNYLKQENTSIVVCSPVPDTFVYQNGYGFSYDALNAGVLLIGVDDENVRLDLGRTTSQKHCFDGRRQALLRGALELAALGNLDGMCIGDIGAGTGIFSSLFDAFVAETGQSADSIAAALASGGGGGGGAMVITLSVAISAPAVATSARRAVRALTAASSSLSNAAVGAAVLALTAAQMIANELWLQEFFGAAKGVVDTQQQMARWGLYAVVTAGVLLAGWRSQRRAEQVAEPA